MKEHLENIMYRLRNSRFCVVGSLLLQVAVACQRGWLWLVWFFRGARMPNAEDAALIRENVTFVFKSFQRQKMAKQLYRNIQRYYPGVRVIIADDSSSPLKLQGEGLEIVQLPFNSGLSFGLNRALERVQTPFFIRMDDDELLTPYTRFHDQLRFLLAHPEADIAAVSYQNLPGRSSAGEVARKHCMRAMGDAPLPLKIPHLTRLDKDHVVVYKPPNIFLACTEAFRQVGYDDQIHIIDHHELFYRAAGVLVTVLDMTAYVLHRHDPFDVQYEKIRLNVKADKAYIQRKWAIHLARQGKGKIDFPAEK